MLSALPRGTESFARLLETKDDAAVVSITPDLCLVQTVDFFTPIVDDPWWFGQIAAANALSDIYAMGARPLTAMNLVAWPTSLGMASLAEVLRGGMEKVEESGAEMAGGHSIEDKEPKYGLAVTGVARPQDVVYNGGAREGDLLVLTKRIGIGVLASALKNGLLGEEEMLPAMREAARLNDAAARAMLAVGVHACTDVSGFGLLGHVAEMLDASSRDDGVGARIHLAAVPLHEGVTDLIERGVYAGGLRANRAYLETRVVGPSGDDPVVLALYDPQTSGGLLFAVAPDRHESLIEKLRHEGAQGWAVGEVVAGVGGIELAEGSG
jgi:selenide,water dikinase